MSTETRNQRAREGCASCLVAEGNPWTGHYTAGCPVCEARQVSHAPKVLRERYYATINDPEERAAFMEAVRLAYERRLAWSAS